MRKIKSVAVALVAAAGLLAAPSAANAASIRPAESVYTLTGVGICAFSGGTGCADANVSLYVYTTYSYSQIWINGNVDCAHGGAWVITWCSNTNNGQSYINLGMNWMGSIGIPSGSYAWWRVNIFANGAGCDPWSGGGSFFTNNYECEIDA
jgi:hypothetical protein